MNELPNHYTGIWDTDLNSITRKIVRVPSLDFIVTKPHQAIPNVHIFEHPEVDAGDFSASYVYLRKKTQVSLATSILASRTKRNEDGSLPDLSRLEEFLYSDLGTLSARFDNFVEIVLREALFGRINVSDDVVDVDVDYKFENILKETNLAHGIESSLRKYQDLNGFAPTHAYCDRDTYAWVKKLQLNSSLDWINIDFPSLNEKMNIKSSHKNKIAFVNWNNNPLHLVEGPVSDFNAAPNSTGKFAKGWQMKDDNQDISFIILKYSFIPVWDNKKQVLVLDLN